MPLGLLLGLGRSFRRKRTSSLDILTTKKVPRGFYKGKNCKPTGFHTRKGGYVIVQEKLPNYVVPDLTDFKYLKAVLEVDHQVGPNSKLQIEGPDVAGLVIANNFQEDTTVVQSTFDFIEDITAQVAMNDNSQLPEKRSSHATVAEKSIELMGEKESQIVGEEADSQLERNFDVGGDDRINSGVTTRNSETELINWEVDNWEVDDVEPLMVQQQLITQGKEKEASNWVQQNLIKLGKIFGIDFQGHEEEATELLMQIDSCRQARKLESCSEIKKPKTKGV
uniref:Uncharacterized protein n=1 Tax=Solanum tuberosum TaxID=4113 RepID=M1D1G6_SOLTU